MESYSELVDERFKLDIFISSPVVLHYLLGLLVLIRPIGFTYTLPSSSPSLASAISIGLGLAFF